MIPRDAISTTALFITLCLCLTPLNSTAEDLPFKRCSEIAAKAVIATSLASASALSNVTTRKGSLRYELDQMLTSSLQQIATATHPNNREYIALATIPNKFLDDYSDKDLCQKMHEQTSLEAIRYTGLTFSDKGKLIDWFYDFTQGKGAEGENLYQRCPGDCSPQYRSYIAKEPEGLKLDVHVICGPARDKWDNQYQLKSESFPACSMQ